MSQQSTQKFHPIKSFRYYWLVIAIAIILMIVAGVLLMINHRQQSSILRESVSEESTSSTTQADGTELGEFQEADLTVEHDLPPLDDDIQSVAADGVLSISADQDRYQVGQTLQAQVNLSTSTIPDGVQFVINYDPALLQQVSLRPTNTFGSYVTQKIDQESGVITAVLLREPEEKPDVTVALPLLTITGQLTQSGSLELSFDQTKTDVAAAAGQDILKQAVAASVTVN